MKLPKTLAHIFLKHICDNYYGSQKKNSIENFMMFSKDHLQNFFTFHEQDKKEPINTYDWFRVYNQGEEVNPDNQLVQFLKEINIKNEDIEKIERLASISYSMDIEDSYSMGRTHKTVSFDIIANSISHYYKKGDTIDLNELLEQYSYFAPEAKNYKQLKSKVEFEQKLQETLPSKPQNKKLKI